MQTYNVIIMSEEHLVTMTREVEASDEFMAEMLAFDIFELQTELKDPNLIIRVEGPLS